MGAPKGTRPPNAGIGRKRGVPNKVTTTAREMFIEAAKGLGGLPALIAWGQSEPGEFWKLYARLIPQEHAGAGGEGPVSVKVVHEYLK